MLIPLDDEGNYGPLLGLKIKKVILVAQVLSLLGGISLEAMAKTSPIRFLLDCT